MKRQISLILFILMVSLACAVPLCSSEIEPLIFLNNREFKGNYIKIDDEFFLEAQSVLAAMPERGFTVDIKHGLLRLGLKEAPCIYNSRDKSSHWYVSGRKLAGLIGGTYRYEKGAGILDIYAIPAGKKPVKVGFPPILPDSFLGRDYEYSPLIQTVSRCMGKDLKMTVGSLPVEIFFVGTPRVQALGGPGALGYTTLEHRDGRLILSRVYITSEKDDRETAHLLAHEFAHLWQDWKSPGSLVRNSKFVEGFAEWVAYKTCLNLGYDEAAARCLENKARVYHDGLRYYLDLEKRYGQEKVFRFIEGKFIP